MSGSLVPFNYVPANLRVPLFYAEFSNVAAGASQPVQRRLLIGQATTTVPAVPTYVPSIQWAQSTFGARSQLAAMIAIYKANDPTGELWALPLADAASSTAATGSITISGTATAAGTLYFSIAPVPSGVGAVAPVMVGVNAGDTAPAIATNIGAALTAAANIPVTNSVATDVVTLNAANKGTLGNTIPIVLNYLGAEGGQSVPTGITVTIAAMAGGATDPSLTGLAATLGVQGFDFIGSPYGDATSLQSTTALMNDSSGRWSYQQALYGHVFTSRADTVANLLTDSAGLNDQHLTLIATNQASPTPPWMRMAAFMAQFAASSVVQPNRPTQTLVLQGVLPAAPSDDFTFSQQQSLLSAGVAVSARGPGGVEQIVRSVTTYQTNSFGQADTSYLDAETMFSLAYIVRTLKGDITSKFPRALIADDGTRIPETPAGDVPTIVTPSIIKGELIAQYGALVDAGICENEAAFSAGLVVQRNANDNTRVDVLYDPYLVSGLRIFAALTQFHLQALQTAA